MESLQKSSHRSTAKLVQYAFNIITNFHWKNVVHSKIKSFDPNIDYDLYLRKFREEFDTKWENIRPSPSTGLQGFQEIGLIGSGSFGNVYLVQSEITGNCFAAKILSKEKIVAKRQVANVHYEKKVLYSINFPNHTHLEFSRKDFDNLYLGMSLVNGGELFLYHRKAGRFSEKQACFYAAQIYLAFEYLHYMDLIYRDLKPENICFDLNGYVKVTDYGFTKHVPNRTLTLCGTPEYLAPEVIKLKPYGFSVDWWTFGIFIYELVAGFSPFAGYANDPLVMFDKICSGKFKVPSRFSPELKNLVMGLLETDLTKRIGVANRGCRDIKHHKWFNGTDWYGILNQVIQPPYVPTPTEVRKRKKDKRQRKSSDTNQFAELFEKF